MTGPKTEWFTRGRSVATRPEGIMNLPHKNHHNTSHILPNTTLPLNLICSFYLGDTRIKYIASEQHETPCGGGQVREFQNKPLTTPPGSLQHRTNLIIETRVHYHPTSDRGKARHKNRLHHVLDTHATHVRIRSTFILLQFSFHIKDSYTSGKNK